jgi:hypothetical protein
MVRISNYKHICILPLGRFNVVGMAIQPGRSVDRIPVGKRFFPPVQSGPGAHPALCTMDNGFLFGGLRGQRVALTTQLHVAPGLKKE